MLVDLALQPLTGHPLGTEGHGALAPSRSLGSEAMPAAAATEPAAAWCEAAPAASVAGNACDTVGADACNTVGADDGEGIGAAAGNLTVRCLDVPCVTDS